MIKLTYIEQRVFNARTFLFNRDAFLNMYVYSMSGFNHAGSEYFKCHHIVKSKACDKKIELNEFKNFIIDHD